MPQHPAPLSLAEKPAEVKALIDGDIPISAFWWQWPWKKTSGVRPSFRAIRRARRPSSFARYSSIMNTLSATAWASASRGEIDVLVAEREDAARLRADNRDPGTGIGREQGDVLLGDSRARR